MSKHVRKERLPKNTKKYMKYSLRQNGRFFEVHQKRGPLTDPWGVPDKTFSNIYRHLGFSITFSDRFKENCYPYNTITFQIIFKNKISMNMSFD